MVPILLGSASRSVLGVVGAVLALAGCLPSQLPAHDGLARVSPRVDYGVAATWFELPNGLKVALVPEPHANLISVDVRYMVGSSADPPGKAGLAHLAEHILFQGRDEPAGPTLADRLRMVALEQNAYTTLDATHFYSVALAPQAGRLLALEAARLASGCRGIDQAVFERELAVVALEVGQRPDALRDAVYAAVFGAGHAYAHSTGGRVESLTLADVCSFVDAHYAPNRAALIVGGRFDVAAVGAAIRAQFGQLPRRATGAFARILPAAIQSRVSKLELPIARPTAMIILPAARWGSREAVDDALLDDLITRDMEIRAERRPWIVRVGHGILGGGYTAARSFYVTVADPAKLRDAVTLFVETASELQWGPTRGLSDALGRRRAVLFDQFESFLGRAVLCADALQFADQRGCRLDELLDMEGNHAMRIATRAGLMLRGPRRVLEIVPSAPNVPDAPPELDSPRVDAREIGAEVWHAQVDPAEADRPIALPAGLQTSRVTAFTLPNGLQVVMASDFSQPLVDARLVFPAGLAAGAGHDLTAYLAANLLDHDMSLRYSRDDIQTLQWLFHQGAAMYVQVTDHTTFRIRGPAELADWHLWQLSWLIRQGVYSLRQVGFARAELTRRRTRARGERDGLDSRMQVVREALFGRGHPYARGHDSELDAAINRISTGALEQFRSEHYVPRGATLIIAGRFDPAAMRQTVSDRFGDWDARAPAAAPAVPAMQPARGPTWIAYDEPRAAQVRVTLELAAMSPRAPSHAARAVLDQILRGRIELIRTALGASYGFTTGYRTTPAGDVLQIDGFVDAARAGEVVRRIVAELDSVRAGGDTLRADFVRARRSALAEALADPSIPGATGRRIESAVTRGTAITTQSAAAAVAAVKLGDVTRVIAQDLQPARMVGVVRGRSTDLAAALATAGITGAVTASAPARR